MSLTEARPATGGEPPSDEAGPGRRIDWRAAARNAGYGALPVVISLLVAAVIGSLVILAVRRSFADLGDVATTMWEYGLLNRDSFAYIFSRATPGSPSC